MEGGPILKKMGHGIVHFGRGARFRFLLANLIIARYFGNPRCFPVPKQKVSHIFHVNRVLQTFSCKMLSVGVNLEFPGAVFFDE